MIMVDLSDGNVVQLSGPVTIYESNDVREILLTALAEEGDLTVDLETTGPWDLAGLQLLVAAVVSGKNANRAVRFSQVPAACEEIADRCGLGAWLRERTDAPA